MFKLKCCENYTVTILKRRMTRANIIQLKKRASNDVILSVENKSYSIECSTPYMSDVATCTSCKVKLKNIRKAKTDYYNDYHSALEHFKSRPVRIKNWFAKNSKKVALSALLGVVAIWLSILAVEKDVLVVIDGIEREYTTNQIISNIYADKVAEENNLDKYKVNTGTETLKNDSKIEIRSEKKINLTIMNKSKDFTTYSNTLSEFLKELQPNLDKYKGKYTYFVKEYQNNQDKVYVKDLKNLDVYLMSKYVTNKTITKDYSTKYVENDKLESGITKVKQKGVPAKYIKTKEIIYLNNKRYQVNEKVSKIISRGKTKIIERGTKEVTPSNSVWDRLAKCETGGRWHLNSGNGFYGGLQFSAPTWRTASAKVGVSAPYAHLASKDEQIKAATWLQKNSGWGQWPHCSSKLGLR